MLLPDFYLKFRPSIVHNVSSNQIGEFHTTDKRKFLKKVFNFPINFFFQSSIVQTTPNYRNALLVHRA